MNDASESLLPKLTAARAQALATAGSLCVLAAAPAAALELGDIAVESTLGQPLRASIAYALGPNEQLADQCVYLRAGTASQDLPTITRASATLSGNRILLRGNTPLNEPMMALTVTIDCAYTARLRREYLLMLSPASSATPSVSLAPEAAPARRPVNVFEPVAEARPRPAAAATPVAAGQPYVVRAGDTLSEIVARIPDRKLTLWPAVDAIFSANPQAFADGDVNRLVAGATLHIPASVTDSRTVARSAPTTATPAVVAAPTADPVPARAYDGVREGQAASVAPPTAAEPATPPVTITDIPLPPAATSAAPPDAAGDQTADLAPAVPAANEAADADPIPEAVIDIPDTAIVQAPPAPVPVADAGSDNPAQGWLVWLGGSGVAIFLALLLFGRKLRGRPGASPLDDDLDETQVNEELFNRRSSDRGEPDRHPGIDLASTLGPADEVSVAARADGSDFDTGEELDVALDYSFASSGEFSDELDFVVGEEPEDDRAPTREMPRAARDVDTSTGNYDMSMVIDVTKQDFTSGRSRDLNAIEVEPLDSRPRRAPGLDLTTEFDYKILEQDYEEELSATQALNIEIAEAARELQARLDEFDDTSRVQAQSEAAEDRSQISMAEDLDGTAEVKSPVMEDMVTAENEALGADEDTDLNLAITAELPGSDETVEMPDNADATVQRRRNRKTG